MTDIIPWLGVIVLILTGWAIVKKYQVNMVLFIGGLLLNILALCGGLETLMTKGGTGFIGFDLFELLKSISTSQVAGVGFIILFLVVLRATCKQSEYPTVLSQFVLNHFPLSRIRI